jgi:hypothetical protein
VIGERSSLSPGSKRWQSSADEQTTWATSPIPTEPEVSKDADHDDHDADDVEDVVHAPPSVCAFTLVDAIGRAY